jgi:hypothetical protein
VYELTTNYDTFIHSVYLKSVQTMRIIGGYLTASAKVKSSLCLTKHHAMKTYGGVEI